ncbi:DUF4430 domain-containing protein [Lactobacillus amylolyticus]|uniref:Transcobalamin-like C-terminal domain-containing protein n=1 Tax=Lactobacillus amylolyticus DSM 11664 TaxID=585524 RepID=D4YRL2_9LACO|nr:DUF4430 domain-containing protein [Lactobacillus amylolyticus]EFG56207.1 hypothetical protein HMPREF0493_0140 [Lactobacillus amylolyticus DSM 11664]KRL18269.1 hypothetical protein FD39_GL000482 [Lactobacillus amylolyticus DSM 11664]QFY04094.1 DUF4430 domain-containing protein [Lactobacillus amylolyticus]TDG62342.1 hypothetical protein C5L18_000345 [Lactobacillus amylolyticus]
MNKLVKKLGLLFTVILLSLGAVGIADANHSHVQAAKTIRVTYTLKNNKKTIAKKNIRVKKHTTVLAALKKCWKVKSSGGFVTSIHGYSQNKSKKLYWTYTVNGKWANAANKVYLHNKDRVVWTRSKF